MKVAANCAILCELQNSLSPRDLNMQYASGTFLKACLLRCLLCGGDAQLTVTYHFCLSPFYYKFSRMGCITLSLHFKSTKLSPLLQDAVHGTGVMGRTIVSLRSKTRWSFAFYYKLPCMDCEPSLQKHQTFAVAKGCREWTHDCALSLQKTPNFRRC